MHACKSRIHLDYIHSSMALFGPLLQRLYLEQQ